MILFDKRGTGLSDRNQTPDLDMRADDLQAVLDAVGSERAVLFGDSEGAMLGAFFAATHPDRVLALVLYNSQARRAWAPDYPIGFPKDQVEEQRAQIEELWGSEELGRSWLEHNTRRTRVIRSGSAGWPRACVTAPRPQRRWPTKRSTTRPTSEASWRPCKHRRSCSRAGSGPHGAADLAERIPGALYVQLPGQDWIPYAGNIDVLFDEVERFVLSVSAEEATFDRVLATVLFTDIVGSTEKVGDLGDARRRLVERHHRTVRA